MGYFQVRYDSRVVNYDRRGFIGLATGCLPAHSSMFNNGYKPLYCPSEHIGLSMWADLGMASSCTMS